MDKEKVDKSFVSRYTMNYTGIAQQWTWSYWTQSWVIYFSVTTDRCDNYNQCGPYGSCNVGGSPPCNCLDHRFVPKDREAWDRVDFSSGCVRSSNLSCRGDVLLEYSEIKLPDARNSWNNATMNLDECRAECLKNCSYMGYSQLDVRQGSGCLIWFNEFIDIRTLAHDGLVIYIRMSSSEADFEEKMREIIINNVVSMVGVVLFVIGVILFFLKRRRERKSSMVEGELQSRGDEDQSGLPFWDISVILKATDNFSSNNKLGEGGFGPVYKGTLEGGQEIAVKRLSKESTQGLSELKNEIILIAKLQHRNLVKLLGCCIHRDESMLVYEYLPNKSLDVILFDQTKSGVLDWPKRFQIINGTARGLLYLHQDSRLRIIHRDLKASNILLDLEMNPKISDFGLARSFGGNETEAHTHHVVGTYGYMSPEYAVDGMFSIKSDVFSFGVLVLEIVSGQRNRGFSHPEHSLNLLGHAWKLYKEGRWLELVDTTVDVKHHSSEINRSIKVGLLCVQKNPKDRPSMSSVVWMLGNEGNIPEAKEPGFFTERSVVSGHKSSRTDVPDSSTNVVTITMPFPR